jgi:hypothetical protein
MAARRLNDWDGYLGFGIKEVYDLTGPRLAPSAGG